MFSRISDILEKGADLLEVESAVAFRRLLRLGAAIALFVGLVVFGVMGVLCFAAAGILAAQAHFGLIASLFGAGLVIFLSAGGGIWFLWRRTKRLFEQRSRSSLVERAKAALRESMTQREDEAVEAASEGSDPLAARVIESIMKNPELAAAAGAAFVAILGPNRVLRGIGHAAGLVSGWVAILRMGREAGIFKDWQPRSTDRYADNGRTGTEAHGKRGCRME